MDFTLSERAKACEAAAGELGGRLVPHAGPDAVVAACQRAGLLSPEVDLLTLAISVQALATERASAGIVLALHGSAALGRDRSRGVPSASASVFAIALSSDTLPVETGGRLSGTAAWVAPLTRNGVAVVGIRKGEHVEAGEVLLDATGVTAHPVETAALDGLPCGHLGLDGTPWRPVGPTAPFMARVRVLLAAAGVGMGQRALREALAAARGKRGRGAGGEQTVQGLLADAATELDAAMLLVWKAAATRELALGAASLAKLAATDAAQRAVARATQVVGADSFGRGHVVERLAQDVRALELFAGRTESLREAVALEELPG